MSDEVAVVEEEPRDEIAPSADGAGEISEPVTDSEDNLPDFDFSDDGDLTEAMRESGYDIGDDAKGEDEDDNPEDDPDPAEMRAGGASRTHDNGNIYWLNTDQLREFNRMDRTIKSDADFWAWFDAAVSAWGKKPIGKASKKRGQFGGLASWSSGSGGGWSGWGGGAKKYLSDWWGGSNYFGGGSSDKVRKLAVAVQAISTTIRVVDSHDRRMRVVLAENEEAGQPLSYTSYDEKLIQVSPMALLDTKIEEGEGIDITTGFALHEASHAEYSEKTLRALTQPTLLRPISIASLLHNVLEDVRIEDLTGQEFPGFRGYFDKSLEYLWSISKDHRPKTWGPELKDKLSSVIAAAKWYSDYKPIAAGDAALAAEVEWWHDWVEGYKTSKAPLRALLIAGLDRLKADPDTKKQMDEMEAKEKAMEKAEGLKPELKPEDLKKLVKKMLEEAGMGGLESCSSGESPGGGVADPSGKRKPGIGAGEGAEVNRLVKSEIEAGFVKDMKLPNHGGHNPRITVLRPPETAASKRAYVPANPGIVSRMRRVFFFRPSAIEETERLMKTGSIDDDELWRGGLPDGDYRMFEQRRIESAADTSITLLIDASGSMGGYSGGYGAGAKTKVGIAIELAQIMLACLKDMNGVRTYVRAHTGDTTDSGGKGVALYKVYEPGDSQTRLSLMHEIQMGNNYDGYAIGWCIRELVQHKKPNEQMVLIVLSDGYPAGSSYSGEPAYAHMRETIAWGEKQGVDTIQIAIEGGMNQEVMFKNFVRFESTEKLPAQLTALLTKIFPTR